MSDQDDWAAIRRRVAHRAVAELFSRWIKSPHVTTKNGAMTSLVEALAQLATDVGFNRHNIIDATNAAFDEIEGNNV